MFAEADVVVWRNVWLGSVRHAFAMYLVELSPKRIVLFLPEGSVGVAPEPRGVHREWRNVRAEPGVPGLFVHRRGELHTARLWDSRTWYCNVEKPMRQTRFGFDTRDLVLDVLIDEDGRRTLKDEDELPDAVRLGLVTADEATSAREEAARVADLHDRGAGAFGERWEEWRPPGDWARTELPEGWDVV